MTANAMRLGLVGCGRISRKHIEAIRATDGLELVAACDPVSEKVARVASETGASAYPTHRDMLAAEKLDVVAVLTESGSHARVGIDCAPHVGALIVEKPMALTLQSADQLIETCDAHRTRLFVVKQNRYNPPVVALRKAVDAGRFGKFVLGTVRVRWCRRQGYYDQDAWRGTWRDDGGVLTNQASHHLDLLQWLMGPVESVMAYTCTRLVDIETEDTAAAVLRFTSGALGVVEATTATRPEDLEGSLSVLGERGSVVISGFAVNRLETWKFEVPTPEDAHVFSTSEFPDSVYGFGHRSFYRDAVESLASGRRSMLDGLEGRKSLELINALYESATSGTEVRLRYVPRGVPLGG